MDFTPTSEQAELAGLARRVLTDHAGSDPADAGPRFEAELWKALSVTGILSAALPAEHGGDGLGLLEQCSVLIEIGRTVAPAPYLPTIVLGAGALASFGSPAQRERWLEPALRGELIITAALATDNDIRVTDRLDGTLTAVPFGTVAGLILVPAGEQVYLVAPDDPGVTITPQLIVDGDQEGFIELDEVALSADRVLGGSEVAPWLLDRATVGLCAQQAGTLERALELTAAYASERVQFGRPIGSFQAVAQRLADAYIDVEAVRLTMWQAAYLLAQGLAAPAELATAKFWAADAGHRVAHTAVHIHGGVGIDLDHQLHRYFTAAKRNEFALGGATAQLLRLGAELAG